MKKTISVLLAVLMLLTVIPFGASAAEDTGSNIRFIVEGNCLWAIDFSGMIRDLASVNKGEIKLHRTDDPTLTEEYTFWDYVEFDEKGVAWFYHDADTKEENKAYIFLSDVNWEMTLLPKEGNLFDDVAAYSFTSLDVYKSLGEGTTFTLTCPDIEATKIEGGLVKQLELDFWFEDDNYPSIPYLPVTVDMDKEITLTVSIMETIEADYTLVPIAYDDNGKLTVSVHNSDGTEGVALINARMGTDDIYRNVNAFSVFIPEGLFRIIDTDVVSCEIESGFMYGIRNLPEKNIFRVNTSNPILRIAAGIYTRITSEPLRKLFILAIFPLIVPFPVIRILRAVLDVFRSNGITIRSLTGDNIRVRSMEDVLSEVLRGLLEK